MSEDLFFLFGLHPILGQENGLYDYLRIIRKIKPCSHPLWNLGRKSGQKNGLNLSEDLFFLFWSSPKSGQKNGLNLDENHRRSQGGPGAGPARGVQGVHRIPGPGPRGARTQGA